MKRVILFLLVLIVGCKIQVQPTPPAAPTTAPAATPAAAPTSPSTTGSASATGTTGSTSQSTPSTTPQPKPVANPERIHQLGDIKTVELGINGQKLQAWVADTDSLRQEGLMFVKDKDIKPNQGMLFVFSAPAEQGFWMKHTYIPLDIAYIDAKGNVISTATMKPFDLTNIPSHGQALYALEMKEGTVRRLGISKGTKIDIPSGVKSQDQPPPPPSFGG